MNIHADAVQGGPARVIDPDTWIQPERDRQTSTPSGSVTNRRQLLGGIGTGVAAAIAGCSAFGGGPEEGQGTPIGTVDGDQRVTIQWAADPIFADNADRYQAALDEAGLPSNVTVNIRSMSFVTDGRKAKLRAMLDEQQSEPTILMVDSGWTLPFAARNQLQNLSQSLPSDLLDRIDEYDDPVVRTARWDGELYAVPFFVDLATILYRRDLVERAGYDPGSENWATEPLSWVEFTQMVSDVADATGTSHGYTFPAADYEGLSCCTFNELLSTFGGAYFGGRDNLFGPVGDRQITVDSEPAVRALRLALTMLYDDETPHELPEYAGRITPEAVLQWTEDPSLRPFEVGEAVAHRNWSYAIERTGTPDRFGENLGTMPIPYGVRESNARFPGTGGTVSALGGWHLGINPYAPPEKKQAAVSFLRAVTRDSFKMAALSIQGLIPPESRLLEVAQSELDSTVSRYLDTLQVAMNSAMPRPVTLAWPAQSDEIATLVWSVLARERSPENAMSILESRLREIENSN